MSALAALVNPPKVNPPAGRVVRPLDLPRVLSEADLRATATACRSAINARYNASKRDYINARKRLRRAQAARIRAAKVGGK